MDINEIGNQTTMQPDGQPQGGAEMFSMENILFLAERKEEAKKAFLVYVDKGDTVLVFCCPARGGKNFFYLTQSIMEEKGWDMDTLYASAVRNMRQQFPCSCLSLEEYSRQRGDMAALSAPAMEQIYILTCGDERFTHTSTGVYYSAKEIRELSESIGSPLYIFQCDAGSTFLCPVEAFTREEAAEILESFAEEKQDSYKSQVLVYEDKKLVGLQEYQAFENRRIGRSV